MDIYSFNLRIAPSLNLIISDREFSLGNNSLSGHLFFCNPDKLWHICSNKLSVRNTPPTPANSTLDACGAVGVGGINFVLHKSCSPAQVHPSSLVLLSTILIFLVCFSLLVTKGKIHWLGTRMTMTWTQ